MTQFVVGTDHPMRDARDRVVGTIHFTGDHRVEGMMYARLVVSPYPHAEIVSIDASDALAMDGVHAVVTGADLVAAANIPHPYFGVARRDQPAVAIDKVRFAGEPVAVVVAETVAIAREAALQVMVDYRELPYVVDPLDASESGAPVIHESWPDNACGSWHLDTGDVDQAFAAADLVHVATYTSPAASAVPLEPHVALARWGDQELEMWASTQWPSAVQRELAHMFGLAEPAVTVHTRPLGGGYGAKGQVKIEPLVASVALLAGHPVRLELDRDEVFLLICKHAAQIVMKSAVSKDGILLARDIDLLYNAGAYGVTDPGASGSALVRAPGPYRTPHVRIRSRAFYTNTVPSGSFRGAMTNQVAFAYESHMDELAAKLDIDPYEFRRRNLLHDGDVYATEEVMHDVHFAELLDDVAESIGWGEESAPAQGSRVRAKGLGVILKSTPTPSRSECRLEIRADGSVTVYSSAVEMGQGASSTIAQLAAGLLGVGYDDVHVTDPDTSLMLFDTMTAGSRTTFSTGAALRHASSQLQDELAELASKHFGAAVDSVRHENGCVVRGDADPITYPQILRAAGVEALSRDGVFQSEGGEGLSDPLNVKGHTSVHWHQGAVAVEVEVDLETGRVEVIGCHGAAWAGRVVNPTRVRQQSEGAMIMGIGPALFEELHTDDGQVSNPNLSDYMIPSFLDIPLDLTSSTLVSAEEGAELHGVGEMTIPATAPAIANAVHRATGVRIRDLPMTAERVLRAIQDSQ